MNENDVIAAVDETENETQGISTATIVREVVIASAFVVVGAVGQHFGTKLVRAIINKTKN